jgi:hypothetical protein
VRRWLLAAGLLVLAGCGGDDPRVTDETIPCMTAVDRANEELADANSHNRPPTSAEMAEVRETMSQGC